MSRYIPILKRYTHNPVLTPSDYPNGACDGVFNCGQTMYNGKTILLVACIPANAPAAIHVAESDDGTRFAIQPEPFITTVEHPDLAELDSWIIDPSVTRIGDTFYITRPTGSTAHVLLYKTTDFQTVEFVDCIGYGHNRVACLFPDRIGDFYYKLDRPSIDRGGAENPHSIWISRSPDLLHWGHFRPLINPWMHWNGFAVGPTPPIRTERGWLLIIHGVTRISSTTRYSLGAVLLDLHDPYRMIGRMNSYLLKPEADYERRGRAPDVVFTCGAIADLDTRQLRVYYGAADTCIALAKGDLDEIIDACLEGR